MKIPGETCAGYIRPTSLPARVNLMKAYKSQYETPVKVGNALRLSAAEMLPWTRQGAQNAWARMKFI